MPRRPLRVFSITTPCTLLATLIMFATESIASVCPDEAPVDRSKQGEWTCTFQIPAGVSGSDIGVGFLQLEGGFPMASVSRRK